MLPIAATAIYCMIANWPGTDVPAPPTLAHRPQTAESISSRTKTAAIQTSTIGASSARNDPSSAEQENVRGKGRAGSPSSINASQAAKDAQDAESTGSRDMQNVASSATPNNGGQNLTPGKDDTDKTAPSITHQNPVQVRDLATTMSAAGFAMNLLENQIANAPSIQAFVLYGTMDRARKAMRGDQFDRAEAGDAAQKHREGLKTQTFLISNQPIFVPRRDDFQEKGLFVTCRLGIHLDANSEQPQFSGSASAIHLDTSNKNQCWYLTKDGKLGQCQGAADAAFVLRNNGVLYLPEGGKTDLTLVLSVELDDAKAIARNAGDYLADVVISDLRFEERFGWGYFNRSSLISNDWDCLPILRMHFVGLENKDQPDFFEAELEKPPSMLQAELVSFNLKKRSGKVIAGYLDPNAPPLVIPHIAIPVMPPSGTNTGGQPIVDRAVAATEIKKLGGDIVVDPRNPGKIVVVRLNGPRVTDDGLACLDGSTSLQTLNLSGAEISDAGLQHLGGLTNLQTLNLEGTKVTDAGLGQLKGLTKLHTLVLGGTKVTNAGVRGLQTALPNCRIVW